MRAGSRQLQRLCRSTRQLEAPLLLRVGAALCFSHLFLHWVGGWAGLGAPEWVGGVLWVP